MGAGKLCDHFHAVTRRKLTAVRLALAGGVDVFFSDPDVTWCADAAAAAVAHLATPAAEAAAADAAGDPPRGEAGLAFQTDLPGNLICSGLYLARARPDVVALFDAFAAWPGADDQAAVNAVLCDATGGGSRTGQAACTSASGVVGVLLPLERYISGALHYTNSSGHDMRLWYYPRRVLAAQCPSMRGAVPAGGWATARRVAMHNNHIWPGAVKVPRFLTQGMWFFDAPAAGAAAAALGVGPPPPPPPVDGVGGGWTMGGGWGWWCRPM